MPKDRTTAYVSGFNFYIILVYFPGKGADCWGGAMLSIMTFSVMTLSRATPRVIIFSIITCSIVTLFSDPYRNITLHRVVHRKDTQQNHIKHTGIKSKTFTTSTF
jgi:hypothetical protein